MKRTLIFEDSHLMFRNAFRKFVDNEIAPHHAAWEKEGIVPRDLWLKAGQLGFLGMAAPEAYGGSGVQDYRYNAIIVEELARAGASGVGFPLHTDIVLPYFLAYGTPEQKQCWLPKMCSGEAIAAIAMTEPGAGSDLAATATTMS